MRPATLTVVPVDGKLQYTVSADFTVNLTNYESKKLGGVVSGVFEADADPQLVGQSLYAVLYEALNQEVADTKQIAQKNKSSVIHLFA